MSMKCEFDVARESTFIIIDRPANKTNGPTAVRSRENTHQTRDMLNDGPFRALLANLRTLLQRKNDIRDAYVVHVSPPLSIRKANFSRVLG